MSEQGSIERLKKVAGKKKGDDDVWTQLYRLNTFAANLGLLLKADDGYPVRKTVGKPRSR